MKTLLTLPLLLLSLISFPSWSETYSDLVERDGIHYKKFSNVPFNGEVKGIFQGRLKNGKQEGPWVNYWINGQLMNKGDYKNGKKEGFWVSYYDDGWVTSQGDYKNGKKEGPWVMYYGSNFNGQLFYKGEYKNGKEEGRWVYYSSRGIPEAWSGVYKNGVKISD